MFEGARHLQNIHPLVIHFPIAFLWGAALFYFASVFLKHEPFAIAGFWVLMLGALGLAAAVLTGLYAENGVMLHLSVRQNILLPHKNAMIFVSVLCGISVVWALVARPFPKKGRIFFLFLLLAMVAAMTLGADYGGRLVYDYNAGGTACRQPIHFTN